MPHPIPPAEPCFLQAPLGQRPRPSLPINHFPPPGCWRPNTKDQLCSQSLKSVSKKGTPELTRKGSPRHGRQDPARGQAHSGHSRMFHFQLKVLPGSPPGPCRCRGQEKKSQFYSILHNDLNSEAPDSLCKPQISLWKRSSLMKNHLSCLRW